MSRDERADAKAQRDEALAFIKATSRGFWARGFASLTDPASVRALPRNERVRL